LGLLCLSETIGHETLSEADIGAKSRMIGSPKRSVFSGFNTPRLPERTLIVTAAASPVLFPTGRQFADEGADLLELE
jgi:hypothetical protein